MRRIGTAALFFYMVFLAGHEKNLSAEDITCHCFPICHPGDISCRIPRCDGSAGLNAGSGK